MCIWKNAQLYWKYDQKFTEILYISIIQEKSYIYWAFNSFWLSVLFAFSEASSSAFFVLQMKMELIVIY